MGTEFRILGPLEVRVDGTPVAVGGPRQRALLAMLLLSANRVVSRDRLIDELLGGAPAEKADHMLRVQVSRLRSALSVAARDGERLIARPPGYVLHVEPGELDLDMFEELVSEGHGALESEDFELAARRLRSAESLWRGHPLADLEFERFARIDIERLEELRLVASEERTEAELALGGHTMLVPELEARVAEHPLRERSRAQLMLALYRCGRQADALEAYRSGRATLSSELALEPSPALRRLEQSILRQEPALALPDSGGGGVATAVAPPAPVPLPDVPRRPRDDQAPPRRPRPALPLAVLGAALLAIGGVLLTSGGSRPLTAPADSVGMVNLATDALEAAVPAGGPPGGIAAGLGSIWETDTADDLLLQINPLTRSVERIPVGRGPTGVAVGDGEVWVVNQFDRTVSEINPHALATVASFPVGNGAAAIAFGAGSLWVANVTDDTITRINAASGKVSSIPLAGQPGGIAVGPRNVWVASQSTGQLLSIDPSTDQVTQAIQIGNQPAGVAVGAGSVWVANTADRTVSRFDPATGDVTKINVGQGPVGIVYEPRAVWVANSLSGTVTRITPGSASARQIHVGGAPTALAVGNGRLWTTVLPGPAAHVGGTLTVADGTLYEATGRSLDPAVFAGFSQSQMLSMTNDGLVTYRRVGGLAGGSLVPDLATALPAPTDDGRTYTFQMRPDIRYSDGALVRPTDIRHEFERIFRLGYSYEKVFYLGIVGAQACVHAPQHCTFAGGIVADDAANTVTFHLTAPDPDFLYKLAFPWADAIPATTPFRALGRSLPPATGPYMTRSISVSHLLGPPGHGTFSFHTWILVRNPHFRVWNPAAQPRGYPNRIILTNDAPPEQAASAVEANRLDVLLPVPTDRVAQLAAHYTQRFHSEPEGETHALVLNTRVAPFDRLTVRQALNYAVDRNRIVGLLGGTSAGQPTCQILPPSMLGYEPYCPYTRDPSPSGTWRGADLARAQKLVASSASRGMKVTLLVQSPDPLNPSRKIGSYVVTVLDRLGYRSSLRVSSVAYPTLANSSSRTQIGWFGWYQDYPAPSDFIIPLLTCRSFLPRNPANVNDAEFCDRGIDAEVSRASALQAQSPGMAGQAWSAIDRRITNQAPWLPLYNPRLDIATASRVGNYQYHPFWGVLLDQLWVR